MEFGKIEFGPYSSKVNGPPASTVFPQKTMHYSFDPQDDVTPLEAVWLAHFMVCVGTPGFFFPQKHPKWRLIERHFKEVE